jgi:hypothetical protein
MQSEENTAISTYLRYLANGSPIAVDVDSAPAKAAYERGKALSARKIGALNFSCADCHSADKGAQKWIRGQWLGELRGNLIIFRRGAPASNRSGTSESACSGARWRFGPMTCRRMPMNMVTSNSISLRKMLGRS